MMSRIVSPAMNILRRTPHNLRNISTYPKDAEEQMTITDNGDVVVCWHPEKSFPYECSKPLPPPEAPSESIYKMETKEEIYDTFYGKKPEYVREELCKITFTTKHRWFPRSRIKYRKTNTPLNRPYL